MNLNQITDKLTIVSNIYALKFSIDRSADWHLMKIQEELGELSSAYLKSTKRARVEGHENFKKNLQDEIADVLAMTLLFAKSQNIDPEKALHEKWFKYLEDQYEK